MSEVQQNEDLFQGEDVKLREALLRDNAYKTEVMPVDRPYSDEQIQEFKDKLADDSVQLAILAGELEKLKKEYDGKMKAIKAEIKEHTKNLRLRYSESEEEVFLLCDHENGLMNHYDREGKFLFSRKLYPSERQHKIIEGDFRKAE